MSEDITYCANLNCTDMSCPRNEKHIKLRIPHSFGLFDDCPKWNMSGAKWLTDQIIGNRESEE